MKYLIIIICSVLLVLIPDTSRAQAKDGNVIQGKVTSAGDGEALIGATVIEIDASNRVVSSAMTDVNGHYVLKVKDLNGKLTVNYVGFKKQIKKITGKVVDIALEEEGRVLDAFEVVATKKSAQGGFSIPTREIGTAVQTISAKEFEGLQVSSVDEALQGRIAGLDIVANSSDPGSGTSMRIRGVTSINGNNQPLIVVNGIPYDMNIDSNFDFANSNQEQYANLLSINPDDILEITVLKDAGASAIWGSKGANGVLMITTKKGVYGPTRLDYTYRLTRTIQPQGMRMLNGDNFTMLMKEAYFNKSQDKNASNIPEYSYPDPIDFPLANNYNNNTDWVKEVTQTGWIHDHYLTISGGGERASFRVAGGFLTQEGTIIGQKYNRFSTRASLDYRVSDRIKFSSEFSMTNEDNDRNYVFNFDDGGYNEDLTILGIAYRKIPNASVFEKDANGNYTGSYFSIPMTSSLDYSQIFLVNPVALARLGKNNFKSYRISPTFRLQVDLLDPAKQVLRFSSNINFDINNQKTAMFLPQEAMSYPWLSTYSNRIDNSDKQGVTLFADNNLAWEPRFKNEDHKLTLYGSFQLNVGNSSSQNVVSYAGPSSSITDATSGSYLSSANSGSNSWRSLAYMARVHYAYKGRYILDGTYRVDGSTRFGEENRYGAFPGLSFKYILSDEAFMKKTNSWLSMLAFRYSWGISGNTPDKDYLFYSRYINYGSYMDISAIKPSTLQLSNLKWETTSSNNIGIDLGFLDDKLLFDLNFYKKNTKDLLFKDYPVSGISGFTSLPYKNAGEMNNEGWEINFYGTRFLKVGDFSMDFNFNLSNYKNTLVKLDQKLLDKYNSEFGYTNGQYLTRIQEGNSFGSIYGFRYKGVYQYDKYVAGTHEKAPVARNESGNVILDQNGTPKDMYFAYSQTNKYRFRGGDAIYEDINHDGNIDELDIVYLGNSNPKLNGGFGPTFRWRDLSVKLFFNFRYGNKIVNKARMNAENMYYDNNQSVSTNWRWKVDGDDTQMPRALRGYGYNWLGSDRYVEDGSFLRFKYLTFNYSVPQKYLKPFKLNKASFYLTFNNLHVWTKYTGVDPEVGYGTLTSNSGMSVDDSSTPRTKDFTLGISIGL
ncbi:MAG: SusC/RagA family TonB-linked outer membrane protein [Dysgonamonadaceae bacterium]